MSGEVEAKLAKLEQKQEDTDRRLSEVEKALKQIMEIKTLLLTIQAQLTHEIEDYDDKRLRCMESFDLRYVQQGEFPAKVQKEINDDRGRRGSNTSRTTLIWTRILDASWKVLVIGFVVVSLVKSVY